MPLRLDNAKSVAHMPTAEQQQTKKDFKPRFKVDPAASPMPEIRLPERLATGRHQNRNAGRDHLGMLGEIKSEYPGEIVGIGRKWSRHGARRLWPSFSLPPRPRGKSRGSARCSRPETAVTPT